MSANPKIVLFVGRGGRLHCGDLVSEEEDKVTLLTNPRSSIPRTVIKHESKLSPHEACERHNQLLDELAEAREALARISDMAANFDAPNTWEAR